MVVVPEGHAAAGSRRRRRLDDKSGRRVHSEPASAKGVGARRRSGQAKADWPRDLRKTTVCPTVETSAVGELCWNVHETRPTLFLACSPGLPVGIPSVKARLSRLESLRWKPREHSLLQARSDQPR